MVQKNYTPKTLEKVEQYRKLLLTAPTPSQVKEKLGLRNKRAYDYLMKAYKDVYNNEEIKIQRANEVIEKITIVERKAFNDYLKGETKAKEYTDVLDYCIKLLSKYGFAPTDVEKIQIEHTGGVSLDLVSHFKQIEAMLIKKKKALDTETPYIDEDK
jgi:hypothetical protein